MDHVTTTSPTGCDPFPDVNVPAPDGDENIFITPVDNICNIPGADCITPVVPFDIDIGIRKLTVAGGLNLATIFATLAVIYPPKALLVPVNTGNLHVTIFPILVIYVLPLNK